MSNVYFISDLHLGHEKLAELRGFPDSYKHDRRLIERWNSKVNKKDLVYILGDITMENGKCYYLLNELIGRKKVILGNHDAIKNVPTLLNYCEGVAGSLIYKSKKYGRILLTHIPVLEQELNGEYRKPFAFNIHGHIHNSYKIKNPKYINVSAEVIDYIPKSLEELTINN